MKKTLYILVVLIALLFALAPSMLGFSLLNLGQAVSVSTALSAKLGCSSVFVSGFSQAQTKKDLVSYSPVVNMVDFDYSIPEKNVTTTLFGLAKTSATYREGLGCTLDNPEQVDLDKVVVKDIEIAESQPWPLGSKTNVDAPLIQEQLDGLLRADNEKGYNTRAMLVVKDGKLLAESYGLNVDKETQLLGWSMAKSLTAIMLGHLEYINSISSNPTGLFQDWQQDNRVDLSLNHLLQMSSGLDFDETYAPGSDSLNMLFTSPSASNIAMKSPLAHQPASVFSYSSGTTNLLSRYIHEVLGNNTQKSYDFLTEQIFTPLAMKNSLFEVDPSGVFVGSSYVYASGRDWARLGLLMLNEGELNGHRLLSKDWVKRATTPNSSDNDKRYGYQFWLNGGEEALRWPSLPEDAYAMMGNRKQSVMIIPSKGVVFVRLGWSSGAYPMDSNYRKLLDVIN